MLHRKRVALDCQDPSLAIQSQKAEADINNIVRNFGLTGQLPQAVRLPQFGDFEGVSDYQSAIEAVELAEKSFMAVPAKIRSEFSNDPQAFADFCLDPSNIAQLREWGLAPTPHPLEPPTAPAAS